jgi:hypothetical protein
LEDDELAPDTRLPRQWLQQMRGQDDGALTQKLELRVESADDQAFLLEKGRRAKSAIEQVLEEKRGHGVGELLLRISEAEAGKVRNVEIREGHEAKGFLPRIEVAVHLVREQHEERKLGMVAAEGIGEHANQRQGALAGHRGHGQALHHARRARG